jgi:homoserine dehydrogenase
MLSPGQSSQGTILSNQSKTVKAGLVGLGTVGCGVYKLLQNESTITIEKIAVQSLHKQRNLDNLDAGLLTVDPFLLVQDPAIELIIEVMGGTEPAYPLLKAALSAGKHVVTANKELIAKHGSELLLLAAQNNVLLLFEGSVAGGIPIIMPLQLCLAANQIEEFAGILNGTTNYILTKMTQEGCSFDKALAEAQALGFAETDPTNDVEGFDVAYKIAVLSFIAFNEVVNPLEILREGITTVTASDISIAKELGYCIKLIGLAKKSADGQLDIRVHPMLLSLNHPLANVQNEFNAIFVKADAVGEVMFYGRGAGEMPTASAVCADVLTISRSLSKGNAPNPMMSITPTQQATLMPSDRMRNQYYLRLNTHDRPGVIGQLGTAFGDVGVSIESVMQKGINADGTASIVIITQEVSESQMLAGLETLKKQQDTVSSIGCLLRVL